MTKNSQINIWESILEEYGVDAESSDAMRSVYIEMLSPVQIVKELNKFVIGQNEAKRVLAIAAWNRLLTMNNKYLCRGHKDYYFEKNNILLIGNTGCGKTHLVQSLAKIVSLPVVIHDATGFTSAGYVGKDVDRCLDELFDNAEKVVNLNYDVERMSNKSKEQLIKYYAEHGIVMLDECDKIKDSYGNHGKDINGRSVQEAFLKMIEGTTAAIRANCYRADVDTSNILFVFAGAFPGLDKIIKKRLNVNQMGFIQNKAEAGAELETVTAKDLEVYGMIPELLGRLHSISTLTDIDAEMMKKIFIEPEQSVLRQTMNEFRSYGVDLSFTDEAIDFLVDKAIKIKLGARSLRGVCQKFLRPLFFYLPSSKITKIIVTKKMLEQFGEPLLWKS